VTVNSLTQFEGSVRGSTTLSPATRTNSRPGERQQHGDRDGGEKRSPDARVELQGPIQSITGASPNQIVTILGVAVNTTGSSSKT